MADRIKDVEDRMLESLFEIEAIADDGFSGRIERRIRRRLWVRRLALPLGVAIGVSISAGPFLDFVDILAGLASIIPVDAISLPDNWIPQLNTVILAAMLAATAFVGVRALED